MGGRFKLLKELGLAVSVLLACSGMEIRAAVYAVQAPTAAADVVYVAGNPDCYPFETYDAFYNSYMGVFPKLLERVSKEIGISFVYVSAGKENQQAALAKNRQVELVTAVQAETIELAEFCPVFSLAENGKTETYGIGFTSIASQELRQAFAEALEQISPEERNALLLSGAGEYAHRGGIQTLNAEQLVFGAGAVMVCLLVYILVRCRCRKKKRAQAFLTDALTGAGNAAYYADYYEMLGGKGIKDLYNVAYIALDMECAAPLFERAVCEKLQVQAAGYLKEQLSAAEAAARVQDGVFAVVFQAGDEKEMYERLELLVRGLNRCLEKTAPQRRDWAAAGVCHLRDHFGYDSMCALQHAKGGYLRACERKQLCCCGSEQQLVAEKRRVKLSTQVEEAFKQKQFQFYFQAVIDSTAAHFHICGAELVSRWQHSEYGLLHAQEYLELLRESGVMQQFDRLAFAFACRQLEQWDKEPYDRLFCICKMSRTSLAQPDFTQKLEKLAAHFCFSHSRLVIALTDDGIAVDRGLLSANLFQCKKQGFRIAVKGLCSKGAFFSDLYDNLADFVMVDQQALAGCVSERRQQLLKDFVALAQRAGAQVLVQGVETKRQQELMRAVGCELQQGYLYARAVPEEEFSKMCIQPFDAAVPLHQPVRHDNLCG